MTTRLLLPLLLASGCAARNYTHYLIEPAPETNPALADEEGTQLRPMALSTSAPACRTWPWSGPCTSRLP